jgi:PGF-pre-PGF domain-containing protein
MKKITTTILIIISLFIISCVYSQKGYISDIASLNGTVYSDNLSSYNFSYQQKGQSTWHSDGFNISNNQNNINFSIMGNWDSSYVNDGEYILRLNVTDNYSQSSYDYVYVSVDNLRFKSPENNSVQSTDTVLEFIGTATGSNYQNYNITYTNDTKPYVWLTLGINLTDNGYPNKTNTTLGEFNTTFLTTDTTYYFNISMENNLGFTNTEIINISFIIADIYEPDDNYSQANEILTNGTRQIHTLMPEYDLDFINFSATADMQYVIETHSQDNGTSDETDTLIYLLDSDGSTILLGDDDFGQNYLSKIIFISPTTQTYYIVMMNYWGYSGGTYEVSVNEYDKYYKGIIPTIPTIPFYTTDENPKTCTDVKNGEYCNMSWNVHSYTPIDTGYDFFTIIKDDFNQSESAKTRVTTVEFPGPVVSISSPTNNSVIDSGSIVLTLTTDVDASCRYSTSPYFYYWDYGWSFSNTGGTTHTHTISTNYDTAYNYYYICKRTYDDLYSYNDLIHHKFTTNPTPECTVDGDCGSGEVCNSNVCEDEPECTDDSDCDSEDVCDSNECVECANDDDCDSGEECNSNVCETEDSDDSSSSSTPSSSPSPTATTTDSTELTTSTTVKTSIYDLKEGEKTKIGVNSENIAISSIKIEVNEDIVGISRFTFETVSEKPERILKKPSKKIYQYINIENVNIESENINRVTFEFMVEKIWIIENNLKEDDIVLLRYLDESEIWETLSTKLTDSGAALITYEAISEGFSTFAVGTKEGAGEEINNSLTNQTINSTESNISNENDSVKKTISKKVDESSAIPFTDDEPSSSLPWTFIIVLIVLVIILSGGFYFYKNINQYEETINNFKSRFQRDPSKQEISPTEQIINETSANLNSNINLETNSLGTNNNLNTNLNPDMNNNLGVNTNLNPNNNVNNLNDQLNTNPEINNINKQQINTNNPLNQQDEFNKLLDNMLNNARMFGPENMKKDLSSEFSNQNIKKATDTINNLFDYIKKQKAKGYDINKIKEVLTSQGWKPKIIEEIVEFIK